MCPFKLNFGLEIVSGFSFFLMLYYIPEYEIKKVITIEGSRIEEVCLIKFCFYQINEKDCKTIAYNI